jgi:hypothetical protein
MVEQLSCFTESPTPEPECSPARMLLQHGYTVLSPDSRGTVKREN